MSSRAELPVRLGPAETAATTASFGRRPTCITKQIFKPKQILNENQIYIVDLSNHLRDNRSDGANHAIAKHLGIAVRVAVTKIHLPDAPRRGDESSRQMSKMRHDARAAQRKEKNSNAELRTRNA